MTIEIILQLRSICQDTRTSPDGSNSGDPSTFVPPPPSCCCHPGLGGDRCDAWPGSTPGGAVRNAWFVCVCVGVCGCVCVFLCMFIYVDDYVCLCSCTFMYVYVWSCMLMIMYVYVCLCSEAYIPIQRLWFCIVSRDISWSWTLERSTLETWTGHVLLGSFDIWEREPQTRSGLSLNTG